MHFIILTFILIISFLPTSLQIPLITRTLPTIDQVYMEGCKAILSGWERPDEQKPFYEMFAKWKNNSPNQTVRTFSKRFQQP